MSGARAAWLLPALTGVLVLALGLFYVARPRDYFTGTNEAGSSGLVANVAAGQRLCLDGLDIPAGTGRVQLRVAPAQAMTAATVVAIAGSAPQQGSVAVPAAAAPVKLDIPIAPRPGAPASSPGRVCVTPAAPVSVAGRPGLQTNQRAPTVDGRPIGARLAAWYLPPAGERRSLLGQLGSMTARAALFRPSAAGAWTYVVLLLAAPPLMIASALALLLRARRGRAGWGTAAAIALIGFVAAASWSLITPLLNAPDELEHMAYAQAIAEQGRAPDHQASERRPYSSEAQVAYEGAQIAGQYRQRDGRPPWLAADEGRWAKREAAQRPRADDGGGWTTVADYTPLYYAALAPPYLVFNGASPWARMTVMRLASAVMGGLAAAFAFLLVAELLPRPRWPAVAAGLLVAFQPMFSFMSGMINNDAGVNALAALALWLVARGLRRGPSTRLAAAIGATAVAMAVVKGNGLFLLPAVALGVAGMALGARRAGVSIRRPLLALGAGAAIAAVGCVVLALALGHSPDPTRPGWYAASGNAYPTLPGPPVQPSGALHQPVQFAEYVWQLFLPPAPGMTDVRPGPERIPAFTALVQRGWASFGFAVIEFPRWVYGIISLAMLGLAALGARAAVTERAALSRLRWTAAVLAVAVLGVFFGTEVAYFAPNDPTTPEFGRYLFPAAAAFAALAAGAVFGVGRRFAFGLATALVVAMAGLWWASEWLAMGQLYT